MIIKPSIFTSKSIIALQTTRIGGQSVAPYDAMNMGIFSQDNEVKSNIETLIKTNNLPHSPIFLNQIHSNKVVEYTSIPQNHGEYQADACFTRKKGIICSILTADCLPVLIADKSASVVAAIHCGWRGLYQDILINTINKIGVNNEDLSCWLGPCISYKPYKVDAQFRQKFTKKHKDYAHCFYLDKKQHWHADLKKITVLQLESLGIKNITQSPYCTYENKNLFYSYRRDNETGRMASLIWINP